MIVAGQSHQQQIDPTGGRFTGNYFQPPFGRPYFGRGPPNYQRPPFGQAPYGAQQLPFGNRPYYGSPSTYPSNLPPQAPTNLARPAEQPPPPQVDISPINEPRGDTAPGMY